LNREQEHTFRQEPSYRVRIMACVIAAEVIAIGIFQFWPSPDKPDNSFKDINFAEDTISLEDVVRTKQQSSPPPPPKPQVPIPVPNDEVIEEEQITLDDLNISEYSDSLSVSTIGSRGDADKPVSSPQVNPSVIHIVEPTVPEAAKKANIKAEIYVSFLVDKQGRVEEATISEIKLYDQKTGNVKKVETINYDLTEATLNAALQWKFRPAKNEGKPVKAYSRQVFTFGF
jgi:outer membrane biosynthesis protein TonB